MFKIDRTQTAPVPKKRHPIQAHVVLKKVSIHKIRLHNTHLIKNKSGSVVSGAPAQMILRFLTLSILALLTTSVSAQSTVRNYKGVEFVPIISSSLSYDDNITNTSNFGVTTQSGIFKLKPELLLSFGAESSRVNAKLFADKTTYFQSSQDNYTDYGMQLKWDKFINHRNQVAFNYQFSDGHVQRGRGVTAGRGDEIDTPVRFRDQNYRLDYQLGSLNSVGRVESLLMWQTKKFQNYREFTQYNDWNEATLDSTFYYRQSGFVDFLAEVIGERRRYDTTQEGVETRDSDTVLALIGTKWRTQGTTSGEVKVGWLKKFFESDISEDYDDFTWDINFVWRPTQNDKLDLVTSRRTNDPERSNNFAQINKHGITWSHDWIYRITTTLSTSYEKQSFPNIAREDELLLYTASVKYETRSDLIFQLNITNKEQDSNIESLVYDKNTYQLSVYYKF